MLGITDSAQQRNDDYVYNNNHKLHDVILYITTHIEYSLK